MKIFPLQLSLAISSLACSAAVALAECKVSGPSPMYLGANKTYALSVKVELDSPCLISFKALNSAAHFSSVGLWEKPALGKLISAGDLSFVYTAPRKAGTDSFSLRVCGTDQAGTGCDRLNYAVDVR